MNATPKPWTHWLLKLQILLLAVMLTGMAGVKFGILPFRVAFSGFGFALLGTVGVAALGILVLVWSLFMHSPRLRSHAGWSAVIGLIPLITVVAVVGPANFGVPAIHDITTDTENPPQFQVAQKERSATENTLEYPGDRVARLQREAYPDLQPLLTPLPFTDAFKRSLTTVEALGWRVLVEDMQAGNIEATEQTQWFGFKDDVVIRITSEGDYSRIDIRSVSRVGKSDLGANAARIRRFQTAFKN